FWLQEFVIGGCHNETECRVHSSHVPHSSHEKKWLSNYWRITIIYVWKRNLPQAFVAQHEMNPVTSSQHRQSALTHANKGRPGENASAGSHSHPDNISVLPAPHALTWSSHTDRVANGHFYESKQGRGYSLGQATGLGDMCGNCVEATK
ncbi:hypothetical protein KUCAC02_008058, partial [Chaenocephalus aceratus]